MYKLLAICFKSKPAFSSAMCMSIDTTHAGQLLLFLSFCFPLPLLVTSCSCHPLEQRDPEEDESIDQQGARWGLGIRLEESGCRMSWNQELWSEEKGLSPPCSLLPPRYCSVLPTCKYKMIEKVR